MNLKGTYKLVYIIDKEVKELTVIVDLLLRDGIIKPKQNLYVGSATINGKPYDDIKLENCIDAKIAAQRIGIERKEKLLQKYKTEGKKIKIKTEDLK